MHIQAFAFSWDYPFEYEKTAGKKENISLMKMIY